MDCRLLNSLQPVLFYFSIEFKGFDNLVHRNFPRVFSVLATFQGNVTAIFAVSVEPSNMNSDKIADLTLNFYWFMSCSTLAWRKVD